MNLRDFGQIERRQADNGFVSNDSGIVVCGECVAGAYFKAVAYGHMTLARVIQRDYEPFDPSEGDDWCSECDKDIRPRALPQGRSRYPVGD